MLPREDGTLTLRHGVEQGSGNKQGSAKGSQARSSRFPAATDGEAGIAVGAI
jgi:hypothetical protein